MNWFQNLRIPGKLLVALLVIAVLIGVLGWYLVSSLSHARTLSVEAQQVTREIITMRKLLLNTERLDTATARYVLTGDPAWSRAARIELLAVEDGLTTVSQFDARDSAEQRDAALAQIEDRVYGVLEPALNTADAVTAQGADAAALAPYRQSLVDEEAHREATAALETYVDEVQARGERDALVAEQQEELQRASLTLVSGLVLLLVLSALGLWLLARSLSERFGALEEQAELIRSGTLTTPVAISGQDEAGQLGERIEAMRQALLRASTEAAEADRRKDLALRAVHLMQSNSDPVAADATVLAAVTAETGALAGTLYLPRPEGDLRLAAAHGTDPENPPPAVVEPGQGITGQAFRAGEPLFADVSPAHLRISATLGTAEPTEIAVVPCTSRGQVTALLELGSAEGFSADDRAVLTELAGVLGVQYRVRQEELLNTRLLAESQRQSEELAAQATDLQEANAALEANAVELEERQEEVAERNLALERAREALVSRAEEVDRASQYKSAFLAKMSHELRTPLNSIMILSERLARNSTDTLTEQQVEFAQTIAACGTDLLELINDVLDLSKIEAGRSDLEPRPVPITGLVDEMRRQFAPLAEAKGLVFSATVAGDLPDTIVTDRTRAAQILRNLLSNAVKFTEGGEVRLLVAGDGECDGVVFDVVDTGPGIAEADRAAVFEPFAQLDNGMRRTAGGTGLGMAISRELAQLLGGTLDFTSEPGRGTKFTLALPLEAPALSEAQSTAAPVPIVGPSAFPAPPVVPQPPIAEPADAEPAVADDSALLIIEDDERFAGILAELARERGLVPVVAATGKAAQAMVRSLRPRAITLDLGLPDIDGWVLLDWLRHHPTTRHTPIHIISVTEGAATARGVVGILTKPASEDGLAAAMARLDQLSGDTPRRILMVSTRTADSLLDETIFGSEADLDSVVGLERAREALAEQRYDTVVIDVIEPEDAGDARDQLTGWGADDVPPLVVLLPAGVDHSRWDELSGTTVVRDDDGRARLLDEVLRFLRLPVEDLPPAERELVTDLYRMDRELAGHTVLVVDDDARNVFSLATVLEEQGVQVLDAENGRDALDMLAEHPEVDLVLMDAMMPVMDGLTATDRLRRDPATAHLPVLMVTALAMPEDRRRAMAAGASDYLTKPVDTEQLLAMIRVWLHGRPG